MSELNSLFDEMQKRFNPDAAADLEAVFQYDIDEVGSWHVNVADQQCSIVQGEAEDATVTLAMDADTLRGVMSGEVEGMAAFMTGRIRASGDIMLATRLTDLFPLA